MAESRRIPLNTLSCEANAAAAQRRPPGALPGTDLRPDRAARGDTVRLLLALFEPDARSFPEFSYSQLVDSRAKHAKGDVLLRRFEQEEKRADDEAAAIAKTFEEKYGGKAKKKDRIQDLIDIGYGYDEEDSFIDNSEAYDEFVPASLTTKFGGFYVNSGTLQFRQASDTEDATTDATPDASKKRDLELENPKKKQRRESGEGNSSVNTKSSSPSDLGPDETKKKMQRKAAGTLSVTSMLKKFQREKEKERQKKRATHNPTLPTIHLCPADAAGGGGSGLTDPLLSLIGSTDDHALIQAASAVDFEIDLDSLLDASEGTMSPKPVPRPAAEVQLFHPGAEDHLQAPPPSANTKPHSEHVQPPRQTCSTSPAGCVPLPEGLPLGLEHSIRKLMVAAKTSEGESKLKFFTPEINSVLLDIELQCREQGGQLRSKVYTHLSSFLPCSRDTLLRRVKKLFDTHAEEEEEEEEEGPPDAEDPVHKLKEAIGKAMPEQITLFHEKCQEFEQMKALRAAEEEKEGKQKANAGPEDNVEEKGGKRGGPKKLFKWNDEIRGCLCRVLRLRMEQYKKERGSLELEGHLKTLLDSEVKPLWPKGWMQSRVLRRESRNILNRFTSLPVRRSRPEKKQPSAGVFGPASLDVAMEEAPALRRVEGKPGGGAAPDARSSTPGQPDQPLAAASLLDLLADQALARERPLAGPQELLAAAIQSYQRSVQKWSITADVQSPPLPPPPPQSSPVGFPLRGACPGVFRLLQIEDFARRTDAVQRPLDDADITIQ